MKAASMIRSALASAAALGLLSEAVAQPKPKEACYGIAKRGQNDCGNLAGTHTCAGQARVNFDPGEWKYVPTGTCKQLKGMLHAEARALFLQRNPGSAVSYDPDGYGSGGDKR